MRLELTEREEVFRDELRAFYTEHVDPDWRSEHSSYEQLGVYLRSWDKVLYEGGWSAPLWPVEFGGRGAGPVERAIFAEETARFDAPEGLTRIGKRLVGPVLMEYGDAEQSGHIGAILRGEEVWCQGFSEPDAGSDLSSLRTRAVLDGDFWVVNGRKVWTSFAQFAEWIFLLVRTGPVDSGPNGISILLVRANEPGIEINPIMTLAGRSEFNEVTFDDVRVPRSQMVGDVDEGWAIVRSVLQHERGADFCLARFVDIRRIYESIVRASKDHPEVATVDPAVLGQLYARVFGIQLLASDLLHREHDNSIPPGLESVLKLFSTETWRRIGNEQVLRGGRVLFDVGGEQMLDDLWESRHYTISAGTSEIQRNLIASRLLRLPSGRSRTGARS